MLLSAHLFSMGGYTLLFNYFMHRSDVQLVNQMYDTRFNSAKLVEIKVAVNMPTQQDWSEYENVQGQVQVKGNYYNYVRLKLTRDTMYFLCLPNTVKDHLAKANGIAAKNSNDIPSTKKSHDSSKKAEFGYDNVYQVAQCNHSRFAQHLNLVSSTGFSALTNPYIESPGKPPNAAC